MKILTQSQQPLRIPHGSKAAAQRKPELDSSQPDYYESHLFGGSQWRSAEGKKETLVGLALGLSENESVKASFTKRVPDASKPRSATKRIAKAMLVGLGTALLVGTLLTPVTALAGAAIGSALGFSGMTSAAVTMVGSGVAFGVDAGRDSYQNDKLESKDSTLKGTLQKVGPDLLFQLDHGETTVALPTDEWQTAGAGD